MVGWAGPTTWTGLGAPGGPHKPWLAGRVQEDHVKVQHGRPSTEPNSACEQTVASSPRIPHDLVPGLRSNICWGCPTDKCWGAAGWSPMPRPEPGLKPEGTPSGSFDAPGTPRATPAARLFLPTRWQQNIFLQPGRREEGRKAGAGGEQGGRRAAA